MAHTPSSRGRGLLIGAGVVMVAAFLSWLMLRHQGTWDLDLGMTRALGWVAQGLAMLVLLGGVALIARGTTRGTTRGATRDATRETAADTPRPGDRVRNDDR